MYIKEVTSASVELGWRQPSDDGGCPISSYTIKQDDGNTGPFTDLVTNISPSTFSHLINSGLTSGDVYRFQVIAINSAGPTTGNTVQTIVADVPADPTDAPELNLDETNSTQMRVEYDIVIADGGSSIISYHLQRSSGAGTSFFDVIGNYPNLTLATSYTIQNVQRGVTYRFRYRTLNSIGWSGWSPIAYLSPA